MNALLISDAYKQSHRVQYPKGTELVYSNWTPRSDKYAKTHDGVVVFGIIAAIVKIEKMFEKHFFSMTLLEALESFDSIYTAYFGVSPDMDHVKALYNYGKLPIAVQALPEGTLCPIRVPMMTIYNTAPEFFWFTNFLETILSTDLWMPMTSATIAREYLKILTKYGRETCDDLEHIPFQAHDFSMRGMAGLEAAMASGAGHLTCFKGSDTIPAIEYINLYYDSSDVDLVATSIPATEHSVMSMGTNEKELDTFKRLITEIYPDGFISIVSDTWDLWKVLTEYLPKLKQEVLARDGRVVIRPDSGDPADIICGINWKGQIRIEDLTSQDKGVIELLWDIFGGTINSKGYKVLDPHIGAIYGDSITIDRAEDICNRLKQKGFASSNIVFGVGSFTYQYNTRDTYGFALKATAGIVDGKERKIYKDPVTDDGMKKSLKGFIQVLKDADGHLYAKDEVSFKESINNSELKLIYTEGVFATDIANFQKIRDRIKSTI